MFQLLEFKGAWLAVPVNAQSDLPQDQSVADVDWACTSTDIASLLRNADPVVLARSDQLSTYMNVSIPIAEVPVLEVSYQAGGCLLVAMDGGLIWVVGGPVDDRLIEQEDIHLLRTIAQATRDLSRRVTQVSSVDGGLRPHEPVGDAQPARVRNETTY